MPLDKVSSSSKLGHVRGAVCTIYPPTVNCGPSFVSRCRTYPVSQYTSVSLWGPHRIYLPLKEVALDTKARYRPIPPSGVALGTDQVPSHHPLGRVLFSCMYAPNPSNGVFCLHNHGESVGTGKGVVVAHQFPVGRCSPKGVGNKDQGIRRPLPGSTMSFVSVSRLHHVDG